MTETRSLGGRPITGDIDSGYRNRTEQWDGAKFLNMLDVILDGGIDAVRWTQCTPYFNDGDTCYFSVDEFTARPTQKTAPVDPESDADDDFFDDEDHPDGFMDPADLGLDHEWDEKNRRYNQVITDKTHPSALPLEKLNSSRAHFETMLLDNFGDHAEITATRDGFTVESYEHD